MFKNADVPGFSASVLKRILKDTDMDGFRNQLFKFRSKNADVADLETKSPNLCSRMQIYLVSDSRSE